jgi:hypothetical protein
MNLGLNFVCKEWVEQYNVLRIIFAQFGFRNNIYYGKQIYKTH